MNMKDENASDDPSLRRPEVESETSSDGNHENMEEVDQPNEAETTDEHVDSPSSDSDDSSIASEEQDALNSTADGHAEASKVSADSSGDLARPSSSVFPKIALVAFLVVAAALAYGGYQLYQKLEQLDRDNTLIHQAQSDIRLLQSEISGVRESSQDLQRALQAKLDKDALAPLSKQNQGFKTQLGAANKRLSDLQSRLDGHQNKLASLSATSREDWKLAEAEYLLKLANQRVLLERDPNNAIALMEAADELVNEVAAGLGDPELFAIRSALAKSLTELRLVVPVDREGIYLQLQALADGADSLPHERVSLLAQSTSAEAPANVSKPAEAGWWAELKAMAGDMNQYIKFQRSDTPQNPLLDVYEAQLTALNLRLLLQQAQVALLKEQAAPYKASLNKAVDLVQSHFPESEKASQYVVGLNDLVGLNVAPTMPNLSPPLKLLHAYVEQMHSVNKR